VQGPCTAMTMDRGMSTSKGAVVRDQDGCLWGVTQRLHLELA
jgi:hypothetical protein